MARVLPIAPFTFNCPLPMYVAPPPEEFNVILPLLLVITSASPRYAPELLERLITKSDPDAVPLSATVLANICQRGEPPVVNFINLLVALAPSIVSWLFAPETVTPPPARLIVIGDPK